MLKIKMEQLRKRYGMLDSINHSLRLLRGNSFFLKELATAKSRVDCEVHDTNSCYCVPLIPTQKEIGKAKGKEVMEDVIDLERMAFFSSPKAKLPYGVSWLDQLYAEGGENCPEDGDNECYCVAFYTDDLLRLVNIKDAVLRHAEVCSRAKEKARARELRRKREEEWKLETEEERERNAILREFRTAG
jgi:hypothetical protein